MSGPSDEQLHSQIVRKVFRRPDYFLAFGFGSGLSPVAPGTVGTVVAVPLYFLLAMLPLPLYLLALLLAFAIATVVCERVSKDLGIHDHRGIVCDEFVGYWLTMVAAPAGLLWALIGFLLFRFFDIVKPFPIGWLDRRIGGGLGIMLDDALAGTFAWFCLQALVLAVR